MASEECVLSRLECKWAIDNRFKKKSFKCFALGQSFKCSRLKVVARLKVVVWRRVLC